MSLSLFDEMINLPQKLLDWYESSHGNPDPFCPRPEDQRQTPTATFFGGCFCRHAHTGRCHGPGARHVADCRGSELDFEFLHRVRPVLPLAGMVRWRRASPTLRALPQSVRQEQRYRRLLIEPRRRDDILAIEPRHAPCASDLRWRIIPLRLFPSRCEVADH